MSRSFDLSGAHDELVFIVAVPLWLPDVSAGLDMLGKGVDADSLIGKEFGPGGGIGCTFLRVGAEHSELALLKRGQVDFILLDALLFLEGDVGIFHETLVDLDEFLLLFSDSLGLDGNLSRIDFIDSLAEEGTHQAPPLGLPVHVIFEHPDAIDVFTVVADGVFALAFGCLGVDLLDLEFVDEVFLGGGKGEGSKGSGNEGFHVFLFCFLIISI